MAGMQPHQILASRLSAHMALSAACGLGERQRTFARALLDPQHPLPIGLFGPDGEIGERRFAVYRNNIVAGLIETLKAAFPVVDRLVGSAFFAAMARLYVAKNLPNTPIMHEYGATFAEFVSTFEPAKCLPYLPDVARLEHAWIEAYHSGDASPLGRSLLSEIAVSDLPNTCLVLHPSTRVIRSRFPIVAIWQRNIETTAPGTLLYLCNQGEDALVVRPFVDVEVRALPSGAATFIQSLKSGVPLADATDRAVQDSSDFDLVRTVVGLVHAGVIVGASHEEAGHE